jgi:hypothetical protein
MLASINPLGERARNQHYPVTVATFIVGATFAGAFLGGALGLAGARFAHERPALVVIALLALAGLLLDGGRLGWRVPGPRRQVEENWLTTYRGWAYGAGFGVQLGLGFTTIVTASATWVAFACALLSGSLAGGLLVGTAYGLVRAMPVLMTARTREPRALHALMRRVDAWEPRLATATFAAQSGLALVAVAVAIGARG